MEDEYMPKYVTDPSNLHLKEYFRKEGTHFDPVQVYAKRKNLFSIKLHHGGKFTASPKRVYVGGKVNYIDNIDVDLFNVDEIDSFIHDLRYDPKQLMFYHFKLPNKSLDCGPRPLSSDADVVSLINIVGTFKVGDVFIEYWLTSGDHHCLSPFKPSVEIEELDRVECICEQTVNMNEEQTVNVNEEHIVNVNDYIIDDIYEFNIDVNLNLDDYTVYLDENMDVNVDENMNVDVNVDEYE
uniref:Transposase, MuDR n=1 Tax=Tanacetum cinerariifolium TaxID=118510 RepID=A0A699KNB6_TANCI|nr:transposase, MuDR [Tanacetum cinerariifolium]